MLDTSRGKARVIAAVFAFATALGSAPPVAARQPAAFVIGTVSLSPERAMVKELLRGSIRDQLKTGSFTRLRSSDRFVISARLIELKTVVRGQATRSKCAVSLVLHRQDTNSLFAVVTGRGSAEHGGRHVREAEHAAVRAAVSGAMRRLSAALQRSSG